MFSMFGEIDLFTGFNGCCCWVGVIGDSIFVVDGDFLMFGVLRSMLVELLKRGLLANLSLVAELDGEVINDLLLATTIAN